MRPHGYATTLEAARINNFAYRDEISVDIEEIGEKNAEKRA